ncbi:MAG: hypothetical protein LBK63_06845 [Treponema sp.]|jgi:hypothetical protein|nr:hypothetical protein [Treponema sp.]
MEDRFNDYAQTLPEGKRENIREIAVDLFAQLDQKNRELDAAKSGLDQANATIKTAKALLLDISKAALQMV